MRFWPEILPYVQEASKSDVAEENDRSPGIFYEWS